MLVHLTPTSKELFYLVFFHSDGTSDCLQSEVNQRATSSIELPHSIEAV